MSSVITVDADHTPDWTSVSVDTSWIVLDPSGKNRLVDRGPRSVLNVANPPPIGTFADPEGREIRPLPLFLHDMSKEAVAREGRPSVIVPWSRVTSVDEIPHVLGSRSVIGKHGISNIIFWVYPPPLGVKDATPHLRQVGSMVG